MSKGRFVMNRSGVAALLKSEEMQGILKAHASAIRQRCGDGYEQNSYVGKNRANAMVYADTIPAKRRNQKYNTLLKALHG